MTDSNPSENETSRGGTQGRRGPGSPLALIATGALSLAVFATAGRALRGVREAGTSRPTSTPSASTPTAEAGAEPFARGHLVFQVHCARCHGPEGHGNGPDAASLRSPPHDLTASPWRTAVTPDSVRETVARGIPGTMMPALGAALSRRELDAVVDFVLAIAPADVSRRPSPGDLVRLLEGAGFTPGPANRAAPALAVRGVGVEDVSLDRLRGKLVLVVFWGTSCAPCLSELPDLERLAARFRGEGLAVLPICVDESDAVVVGRLAGSHAPGLPVYVDPTGLAKSSYDVQVLPSASLIAPDGRWLGQAQGSAAWSAPEMEALIRASLPAAQSRSSARRVGRPFAVVPVHGVTRRGAVPDVPERPPGPPLRPAGG